MSRSSTTWKRPRRLVSSDSHYWKRREASWRKQRIFCRDDPSSYFDRYDYARAWARQHARCGVCGKPLRPQRLLTLSTGESVGVGQSISPDHSHATRLFRSLTCSHCNMLVGSNTARTAQMVADYLGRFEETP